MDEWNRNRTPQAHESAFERRDAEHGDKGRGDRDAELKDRLDDKLDAALEETFPGSDPISVTQPPPSVHDKPKS